MVLSKYGYEFKIPDVTKYDNVNLTNLQKRIILNRDPNPNNILDYVYNKIDIYKDLTKLKYIVEASELLIKHLDTKSHILICTDSDTDGLTSAVMCYRSLRDVFSHPESKISVLVNRRRDGNGFNTTLVNRILNLNKSKKINLLIALDHGSSDKSSYDIIKANSDIELLITDHHQVPIDNYPNNVEVLLNPQIEDSEYTRNISGCTVGFLLMIYTYYKKYNKKNINIFNNIIMYPAISVISDVMSCKDMINRYIYTKGLKEINRFKDNDPFLGLRDSLGVNSTFNLNDVRLKLSPLINAANRTATEDLGFSVLNSYDYQEALCYIEELIGLNNVKKNIVSTATDEILEELKLIEIKNTIVVRSKTKLTVNGVIASRVGDLYKRPTICFIKTNDDRVIAGSCRSIIKGFNILKVLKDIQKDIPNLILNCGGHKSACGLKIENKNFDLFKDTFDKYSKIELDKIDKNELINVDGILKEDDINMHTASLISTLEPYGLDFEDPIFISVLTVNNIILLKGICKIIFKRKNGDKIIGIYGYNDGKYTPDDIVDKLPYGTKVLVGYNIETVNIRFGISINLKIIKLDIWEK